MLNKSGSCLVLAVFHSYQQFLLFGGRKRPWEGIKAFQVQCEEGQVLKNELDEVVHSGHTP